MSNAANKTIASQIDSFSRQIARERAALNGAYQELGLSNSQVEALLEFDENQRLGVKSLAELLAGSRGSTNRILQQLLLLKLIDDSKGDQSPTEYHLTNSGKKMVKKVRSINEQTTNETLKNLTANEQADVARGLSLISKAMRRSRRQVGYHLKPIRKKDNRQIATIIRQVMTEFGAVGKGYSIMDPEVDDMYSNYQDASSCYWVVVREDRVLGGAGIGPLKGGDKSTCELRKMFFLPDVRGLGLGRKLLIALLNEARNRGYKKCYLETLDRMPQAVSLYQSVGFEPLNGPQGNTGHCSCDCWYQLEL